MKKLIIVAAVFLTVGVAKANAGVSFEVSVGDHYRGGGGHGQPHGRVERHYKPHYAPRYVVRECCSAPRYYYGRPVHRHSHYYGGHHGGHHGGHRHGGHGHRH